MDWQTSITFVILGAAGGIVLKRLVSFTRFGGKAGSCGACSGCGHSAKNNVPSHLVHLTTWQDQSIENRSVRANTEELHREFSSKVAAGAEKKH